MITLIGFGLEMGDLTQKAISSIKKADKIFAEVYTSDLVMTIKNIEKQIKKQIILLAREEVESEFLIREAKSKNVVLLIPGDPLLATTHLNLISQAKKEKIQTKIIHGISVVNAITETGLHIYKFGKIASIPKFKPNYKPTSFIDILKQNKKIKAHSLLLLDIGMDTKTAIEQLEEAAKIKNFKLKKILLCSRLGTEDTKIFYEKPEVLKKVKAKLPACIIIPSELHFTEEEFLKNI